MSKTRVLRSVPAVHFALQPRVQPRPLPMDVAAFTAQVAGHRDQRGGKYTGLLQCPNGTVLKPILKEAQYREVDFYEHLLTTEDPDLIELRQYVPKYFGTTKFTYNGYEQEYIILEELTKGMLQPCVMDVKIGKRTWDPLASEQKILNEQKKYCECKQQYSFCIPGYQVAQLASGKLCKYGKQHGKKLNGDQVIDAIRNFLNGSDRAVCRTLLLQLLSQLWRLQRWLLRQRGVALYSASLLLVYDAHAVRACCHHLSRSPQKCRQSITRSHSFHSLQSVNRGNNFSGLLTPRGPHFKKVNSVPLTDINLTLHHATHPVKSPWTDALERLKNNHSFKNNYEEKLNKMKLNYQTSLNKLSSDTVNISNPVGTVKIIDFAHAFFNEDSNRTLDLNFQEGVDSLVNIFEMLLKESEEHLTF